MLSTGAGGLFSYDANGNLVSRKAGAGQLQQTLTWSPLNELQQLRTEVGAVDPYEYYRYDENGERVYQERAVIDASGVSTRTGLLLSYWPFYEVDRSNGDAVTTSYFFGGVRVAQKVSSNALTFLHSDHVGNVRATSTGAGTAVWTRAYEAFGRKRGVNAEPYPSRWRFTGQEEEESGLVYMQARYYDPVTGQFISPDTIVPEPGRLLSYNRYLYARADPLSYNDPTGMYSDQEIMTHFGCESWDCVEGFFQEGGALAGLWGWLGILRVAENGDTIESVGWAGTGSKVSYTAMLGTFAIVDGAITVWGVTAQTDAFALSRPEQMTWALLNGNGFASLGAGMNAQGAMDGYYRIATRGVAMFGGRNVDCRHHDCVTQVLNATSTGLAGVAVACTAVGALPCTGAIKIAGGVVSLGSFLLTAGDVLAGDATTADVAVFVTTAKLAGQHNPRVALGANAIQWAWDWLRRK